MVKALRSCFEAAKGRIKAGHLILRKRPKRTATGSSTASNISRIPIRHVGSTACYSGNIGILDEPGDCQLLAKSLLEGEIVPKLSPVLSKAPEQGLDYLRFDRNLQRRTQTNVLQPKRCHQLAFPGCCRNFLQAHLLSESPSPQPPSR